MLISIIIPTYNVAHYVAEALDSAIAQTYRPIEIIAVDNNSTDGTLSILHDYEARYPDLVTVLQEPKQGAPAARNLGLKHAKGEWIQFLDADDILLPEKVERQVEMIQEHNEKFAIIFGAYFYVSTLKKQELIEPELDQWVALCKGLAGITSSNLFEKGVLIAEGGWDESYRSSQEYDLMFRIVKSGNQALIEKNALTMVRRRRGSISTTDAHQNRLRAATLHFEICRYIICHRLVSKSSLTYQIKEVMLKCLVYLYMKDQKDAKKSYKKYFPERLILKQGHMGRSFAWPYKFFGFEVACILYRIAYRIRLKISERR